MESQPKNPEFRINPEKFHPCISMAGKKSIIYYGFLTEMQQLEVQQNIEIKILCLI